MSDNFKIDNPFEEDEDLENEIKSEEPVAKLRSEKELKIEQEELTIKLEQVNQEKNRLEEMLRKNKSDLKKLRSYRRKTYLFGLLSLVISIFIIYLINSTYNFYHFTIYGFLIISYVISFSFKHLFRLLLVVLMIILFYIFSYFTLIDYLLVTPILPNSTRTISLYEFDICFSVAFILNIVIWLYSFIMLIGNLEVITKTKPLKHLVKSLLISCIYFVVGIALSILLTYIFHVYIDDFTIKSYTFDFNQRILLSCCITIFVIYLFNINTITLNKRKSLKGRA